MYILNFGEMRLMVEIICDTSLLSSESAAIRCDCFMNEKLQFSEKRKINPEYSNKINSNDNNKNKHII